MGEVVEIKTAKITEKGQIAIPRDIRKLKGFREGTKIAILAFRDHVELRPLSAIKKTLKTRKISPTALATEKVLARDWLSKEEDEAWKDL